MQAEIQSAAEHSMAVLGATMNDAFSDYAVPMRLDEAGFARMMAQRGLDRAASKVAVVSGQVVAIWLVSLRGTASYLISSGTRPAFRGRGLAGRMAQAFLEDMRARGTETFRTEVMDGNDTARALYEKIGMHKERGLDFFELPSVEGAVEGRQGSAAAPPTLEKRAALRDWAPTWQNSDAAMQAIADDIVWIARHDEVGLMGYAAVIRPMATLAQLAVRPDMRRRGIGSDLLRQARAVVSDRALRVVNSDAGDAGFRRFMLERGAVQNRGQSALIMRF